MPTLAVTCDAEDVTVKKRADTEKCITVTNTYCKAEVKAEEIELCTYEYDRKDIDAVAEVQYRVTRIY